MEAYKDDVLSCGGEVIHSGSACGGRHNLCGGTRLQRRLILSKSTRIKTHERRSETSEKERLMHKSDRTCADYKWILGRRQSACCLITAGY